jgi:ABC-type proline/glycine betaine transport system permease subunit
VFGKYVVPATVAVIVVVPETPELVSVNRITALPVLTAGVHIPVLASIGKSVGSDEDQTPAPGDIAKPWVSRPDLVNVCPVPLVTVGFDGLTEIDARVCTTATEIGTSPVNPLAVARSVVDPTATEVTVEPLMVALDVSRMLITNVG